MPSRMSLERAPSSELFPRGDPSGDGPRVLRVVRFSTVCQDQGGQTDKLGLSGSDALDRNEEEDEEDGQDGEAFGRACLGTVSRWSIQARRCGHTITPWSQAKMASSYSRVTRSQRAVM